MNSNYLLFFALFALTLCHLGFGLHQPAIDKNSVNFIEPKSNSKQPTAPAVSARRESRRTTDSALNSNSVNEQSNEIEEERIKVGEVYKSLLKTTARFTIEQSPLPKYVKVDTALQWLDKAAYKLSKPSTLIAATKVAAIGVVGMAVLTLVFPEALLTIETTFRRHGQYLERMDEWAANVSSDPAPVIQLVSNSTEQMLARFNIFNDKFCRERSMCMLGESIRCTAPGMSETVSKFVEENFSNLDASKNEYTSAFANGFYDQNCTLYPQPRLDSDGKVLTCANPLTEFVRLARTYLTGATDSVSGAGRGSHSVRSSRRRSV